MNPDLTSQAARTPRDRAGNDESSKTTGSLMFDAVVLAIAAGYFASLGDVRFVDRQFPYFAVALIVVVMAPHLVQALLIQQFHFPAGAGARVRMPNVTQWELRPTALVLIAMGYPLAIGAIGLVLATALGFCLTMWIAGGRRRGLLLVVSIGFAAAAALVFVGALDYPIPLWPAFGGR